MIGLAIAGTSKENLGALVFLARAEYSSWLSLGVSGLSAQCRDISWGNQFVVQHDERSKNGSLLSV